MKLTLYRMSFPITACNLHCHYCYIMQRNKRSMKIRELKYPIATMIKALRKERLGGTAKSVYTELVKPCCNPNFRN